MQRLHIIDYRALYVKVTQLLIGLRAQAALKGVTVKVLTLLPDKSGKMGLVLATSGRGNTYVAKLDRPSDGVVGAAERAGVCQDDVILSVGGDSQLKRTKDDVGRAMEAALAKDGAVTLEVRLRYIGLCRIYTSTRILGKNTIRRYHDISPGFLVHYQYLGVVTSMDGVVGLQVVDTEPQPKEDQVRPSLDDSL